MASLQYHALKPSPMWRPHSAIAHNWYGGGLTICGVCINSKANDRPAVTRDRCEILVGHGKLFLNDFFVSLREFGLGLDAQSTSVVKQLVNGLVGNLPVEQFAHTRLRLSEDYLQLLL